MTYNKSMKMSSKSANFTEKNILQALEANEQRLLADKKPKSISPEHSKPQQVRTNSK